MSRPSASPRSAVEQAPFDPDDTSSNAAWSIVSYVLSGILCWGGVGWLLDRWLLDSASTGTVIFVPVGVVLGAAAGGYLGYQRFLYSSTR